MKNEKKELNLPNDRYQQLSDLAYQISDEMFTQGFSKAEIYMFLHSTVGTGLFRSEMNFVEV